MTITARQLADGQLPNAAAALYTAPGGTTVYIKEITLHNTNVATRACTLWFREAVTGDTRVIDYVELEQNYTHHCGPLILDTGDSIRGDDDSAGGADVDYTIYGATEA